MGSADSVLEGSPPVTFVAFRPRFWRMLGRCWPVMIGTGHEPRGEVYGIGTGSRHLVPTRAVSGIRRLAPLETTAPIWAPSSRIRASIATGPPHGLPHVEDRPWGVCEWFLHLPLSVAGATR
jgi:hypothetical protein